MEKITDDTSLADYLFMPDKVHIMFPFLECVYVQMNTVYIREMIFLTVELYRHIIIKNNVDLVFNNKIKSKSFFFFFQIIISNFPILLDIVQYTVCSPSHN